MDNKEIIEAIAVLNVTLKTLNPEAYPLTDGNASSNTYLIVLKKIEHLTSMLFSPIVQERIPLRDVTTYVDKLCPEK